MPNRFAALPMEGWDGTDDGRPTDLVRRRWSRIGAGGCGLVWGEATAVRRDGRANPNQLVLDDRTRRRHRRTPRRCWPGSRWPGCSSRIPGGSPAPRVRPRPRIAYRHPILDERVGATDDVAAQRRRARRARRRATSRRPCSRHQAGFDFVDIKHCHGYLLHELLSAYDRPGRYGGDFAGRTRFLRTVVEGIRERAPGLAVGVRLSLFDVVPFAPGADGTGATRGRGPLPLRLRWRRHRAGDRPDRDPRAARVARDPGIGLVATTAGSPYYNPHVQRPAYFPPSDGYAPPEDPLVGVARQLAATAEVTRRHPGLTIVGAGYTYLQDWLPHVGQAVVAAGGAQMIGLGRMLLSYPDLAADVLAGRPLERRQICRTFSDCTTAPRNGLVSGCFPLDNFYKEHPDRAVLVKVKAAQRGARSDPAAQTSELSGTTRVDGRTSMTSGPTHRTPTVPRRCPAVSSQFGTPGSRWAIDEADAAVGLELRGVAVQRGLVVHVVERLHPVVVEGDHPVLALGRGDLDDERLVVGEVEVRLVPLDLRVLELVGLGQLGLVGEHVGPLRLAGRPAGADLGDALHVEAGVDERRGRAPRG